MKHIEHAAVRRLSQTETAGVFENSGVKKGARVIINDGTAKDPIFLVGTVTQVMTKDKQIRVLADNGQKLVERIDNTATGMVGFVKGTRVRTKPLTEADLAKWLDTTQWLSKAYGIQGLPNGGRKAPLSSGKGGNLFTSSLAVLSTIKLPQNLLKDTSKARSTALTTPHMQAIYDAAKSGDAEAVRVAIGWGIKTLNDSSVSALLNNASTSLIAKMQRSIVTAMKRVSGDSNLDRAAFLCSLVGPDAAVPVINTVMAALAKWDGVDPDGKKLSNAWQAIPTFESYSYCFHDSSDMTKEVEKFLGANAGDATKERVLTAVDKLIGMMTTKSFYGIRKEVRARFNSIDRLLWEDAYLEDAWDEKQAKAIISEYKKAAKIEGAPATTAIGRKYLDLHQEIQSLLGVASSTKKAPAAVKDPLQGYKDAAVKAAKALSKFMHTKAYDTVDRLTQRQHETFDTKVMNGALTEEWNDVVGRKLYNLYKRNMGGGAGSKHPATARLMALHRDLYDQLVQIFG